MGTFIQRSAIARANAVLRGSAVMWFSFAAIGQWLFLSYVVWVYGSSAWRGALVEWNQHLSGAYQPGYTVNNVAAIAHIALTVVILGGGPLQLIPQIRQRFARFHRWLGRSYLLAVVSTAVAGMYLLLNREIGGLAFTAGFVIQLILIVGFAWMAISRARRRQFVEHRRWALRLFMVASAVWFFRIILMAWLVVTGGVGVDTETGQGPFLDFMAFGQYLPLLLLELYFRAQSSDSAVHKLVMGVSIVLLTLLMAAGTAAAFAFMWLPAF